MDPIDPIDPAFLERSFENQRSGPGRVERVRRLRDDQPGEPWEESEQHADDGSADEDEESVVVDLDHAEQPPDLGPDEDGDGAHIDITV